MERIKSFLDTVKVARKQSHENMTLFPLLAPQESDPDYFTLEDALAKDLVQITEVDESGSVPELLLQNRGTIKILILEGEELVGAKQNRIVNATFLVPGKTKIKLPVSCVEHGRWRYKSRDFKTSGKVMHASLRRASQEAVSQNFLHEKNFRSDQGRIWDDISVKARRLKASAPTEAMADVYKSSQDKLNDYLPKFRLVECQVGAIFVINGEIVGVDCFGYGDTFSQFFQKLVKSYALDAIDWMDKADNLKPVPPDKARSFLASISKSKGRTERSLGLGEDVRFESKFLAGAGFLEEGRVLHLSAFRKVKGDEASKLGFQRFSHRMMSSDY